MKLFYDHLIIIEEIVAVLDTHNLSLEEKTQLLKTIDETMHHHILDVILTHLPKEYHEEFLTKLALHPHDPAILRFLQEKTEVDIEGKILKKTNAVKKKIKKEIQKYATH